jgi:hypothetical protein
MPIVFVRLAGLFIGAAVVLGQELSPDLLTLARAMTTNRDLFRRLPLYTCLETIERARPREHGRPGNRDVVQVDVGVGDKGEMYSWPNENSFSSQDLTELVGHGLLSTGMFSGFAHSLFVGNNGVVRLAGKDSLQGREVIRFTYHVPSLGSRWQVVWRGKTGELQEAGQFWVNAQDSHLQRMQVDAREIPPHLLLRSVTLVMDYDLVTDDADKILLPVEGSIVAVDSEGNVFHNSMAFSHCHVFTAESRMSTGEADAAAVLTHYKEKQDRLPEGLALRVALTEPIVARTARVGDAVVARLESAVRVSPEAQIAAGAVLQGRIRQFAQLDDPPNTYQVGIAFSELAGADRSYRFFAELFGMDSLPGVQSDVVRTRELNVPLGTSAMGVMKTISGDRLTGYSIPGAVTFFLTDAPGLPKGFRMTWRTTKMSR